MSETGLAIVLSIGNYVNDPNQKQFNEKVSSLVDIQTTIWGEKNMGYELVTLDEKAPYLSLNSLVDFIKEARFKINSGNIDYLVITIMCKGNEQYLITSDNQTISWLQLYELFSFAKQFFVPTVFCIDALNADNDPNNVGIHSIDADYESLNVFGFVSSEMDYFGFITNVLYERKDAIHLTDVIKHIMIWNKYIFTVPKEIDWDHDDHEADYERRPNSDNNENDTYDSNVMFAQTVKNVTATEPGGNHWSIKYSIDRKAWGPFLCKYDYSVYVHDGKNNRKNIKSVVFHIERPVNTPKQSKFQKILQNGSFINETLREEGRYAVGSTAFSVTVTDLNDNVVNTSKIFI